MKTDPVDVFCPSCEQIVCFERGERGGKLCFDCETFVAAPLEEQRLPSDAFDVAGVVARGESDEHRRVKKELHDAIKAERGCDAWLERAVGTSRPDVLAKIGQQLVAIEVQLSFISLSQILVRTTSYLAAGLPVAWVLPRFSDPTGLTGAVLRTTKQERFLHGLYFGRVYVWHEGSRVWPIHLEQSSAFVPAFETKDGAHVGGYDRAHKTLRLPDPLRVEGEPRTMSLVDFVSVRRPRWKDLPDAFLWDCGLSPWWRS